MQKMPFVPLAGLIAILSMVSITRAEEVVQLTEPPLPAAVPEPSANLDDWSITQPDPSVDSTVDIVTADPLSEHDFIKVSTNHSVSASYSRPPLTAGTLEFQAKHNKSGLFYVYAQTSDNGGQLLFSIQFTEDRGILLEEADRQITLLNDYVADAWYHFSIDFDSTRGSHGTFIVRLNDTEYGEYEYVRSESSVFDLAQITIGSESTGVTSVSGFADSFSTLLAPASTASDALLLLSISLSSTSISSSLDNGLIVTASLDGIASVATSSIFAADTASTTVDASTTTEGSDSSFGEFIAGIVDSVINLFVPGDRIPPTELDTTITTSSDPTVDSPGASSPTETTSTEPTPEPIPEPAPPTIDDATDEPAPSTAVQSSLSTDETSNDITTTTF